MDHFEINGEKKSEMSIDLFENDTNLRNRKESNKIQPVQIPDSEIDEKRDSGSKNNLKS